MKLFAADCSIPANAPGDDPFSHIEKAIGFHLQDQAVPLRVAITESSNFRYRCEIGLLDGAGSAAGHDIPSIFRFTQRQAENTDRFNAVLLVPTGIGAEIGGHAGDATPVARLLAEICDLVVTHPNVVNASDINEIPANALYVEGSVICRLLMGTAGLQPVRSNRVLVVLDAHSDPSFVNAAVNAVNAARSSFGFRCARIVQLDVPLRMTSRYTESGSAAGEVDGLSRVAAVLDERAGEYDAVALSSVISVPESYHTDYFESGGAMVNPWGGVEAMLTHAISLLYDVPSAHSPMFESQTIANKDPGIVDPRMAAEAISVTFLQCILKGLHRSPRIITDPSAMQLPGVMNASDVSCLIIPDGCIGLPTLAALRQGIPVIAVRENRNLMRNDLTMLPWAPEQLHIVENYWEAVGVVAALRAGIAPESVRRPLRTMLSERKTFDSESKEAPAARASGVLE